MLYREITAVFSNKQRTPTRSVGRTQNFRTLKQTLRFRWLIINENLQFSYPISFAAVTRQSHRLTNTALVGQALLIIDASRSHSVTHTALGRTEAIYCKE